MLVFKVYNRFKQQSKESYHSVFNLCENEVHIKKNEEIIIKGKENIISKAKSGLLKRELVPNII